MNAVTVKHTTVHKMLSVWTKSVATPVSVNWDTTWEKTTTHASV